MFKEKMKEKQCFLLQNKKMSPCLLLLPCNLHVTCLRCKRDLKGQSHEIGEACQRFYQIDQRFLIFPRQVFILFLSAFSYQIFKNCCLSGASFQHNLSNDQYSSGDTNSLADCQQVLRRVKTADFNIFQGWIILRTVNYQRFLPTELICRNLFRMKGNNLCRFYTNCIFVI